MNELMWIVTHYGYYALFFLLALGIVGLPIPDETLMVLAGSMTVNGPFYYMNAFIVCTLGSMTGMLLSYGIGRKVGKPLIDRYGAKVKLTPSRLAVVERWFEKYGPVSIVFGYFVPGIRHLTCYVAGMSRLNFSIYLMSAMIGNFIWVGTFLTIGHMVGIHWETALLWMHQQWGIITVALASLLFIAMMCSIWRWKRKKQPAAE